MKSLRILAALVAALTVTAVFAQEPVPHLQDLVGNRAVGAGNALVARGYESLGGEEFDSSSYAYWRHQDSGECIVVHTDDGHVDAILRAAASACRRAERTREEAEREREPVPHLQDLLGDRAVGIGTTLMERGYDSLGGEEFDDSAYSYWRHRDSGECVVVRTQNDRVASVVGADEADCREAADARERAPHLQDLLGNRAVGSANALRMRGYESLDSEDSATPSYSYWRHRDSGECIVVRTQDGHIGSILAADENRCREAARVQRQVTPGPSRYETICGVTVAGETSRHLCEAAVFHEDGRRSRTVVRYPDAEITFTWQENRSVAVKVGDAEARQGTFSISEGTTRVVVGNRTYYFISDIGMAEREVREYKRSGGN